MLTRRPTKNSRRGFTLVEVSIVLVLLSIFGGGVAMFMQSSSNSYKSAVTVLDMESRGRRSLEKIDGLLRKARPLTMTPIQSAPWWSSFIDFQRDIGSPGAIVWGNTERLILEYTPGEVNDGIDNDRNGLVDEGQVVWIQNLGLADQTRSVIARGVCELAVREFANGGDDNGNLLRDEPGFCIDFVGNCMTIRLSLEQVNAGGVLVSNSYEKSLTLRLVD